MKPRLSFAEAKRIKRQISVMNNKQLTTWVSSIYDSGYRNGYEAGKMAPGQTIDFELLKIAIRATEGIGDKKMEAIINNINNLCFGGDKDVGGK